MTKKQYAILKAVIKYKRLDLILQHTGIPDADTLQDEAGIGMLDSPNYFLHKQSEMCLTQEGAEEFEKYKTEKTKLIFQLIASIGGLLGFFSWLFDHVF